MVKEAFENHLRVNDLKHQEIRIKAQINEYVYEMFKKNGMAASVDEIMCSAFLDIDYMISSTNETHQAKVSNRISTMVLTTTQNDENEAINFDEEEQYSTHSISPGAKSSIIMR